MEKKATKKDCMFSWKREKNDKEGFSHFFVKLLLNNCFHLILLALVIKKK